ncbi:primosomal protein N' [Dactylosporangium roseum]
MAAAAEGEPFSDNGGPDSDGLFPESEVTPPADRIAENPRAAAERIAGKAGAGRTGKGGRTRSAEQRSAAELPVARVCVDTPLPHLDRPFDYLVPEAADVAARPGVRVRVRFAGQLVDGFLLERAAASEHAGRLAFLDRVVSPEVVAGPETVALARDIADRYAGTLSDVLRLAVPPRHARTEAAAPPAPPEPFTGPVDARVWRRYTAGAALVRALGDGRAPRAVWTALPGEDWPARLAEAAAAGLAGGLGALVVVPDARDLDRLDTALTWVLGGPGRHVTLSAALGPAERYRRFLAASRGGARIVIGTRAAAFAPVADLGLVAIWDDGDDLHAEPRAPYPHARQVLLSRAEQTGCGVIVGGFGRTAEAQQLIETGWAVEVSAGRDVLRRAMPRVVTTGEHDHPREPEAVAARLPSIAWRAAREALARSTPVLIQVPRRGYIPVVACADCYTPSRCARCSGPLSLPSASQAPECRWCGRPSADHTCPECGSRRLRAAVIGARRTAEELARAFPDTPVRTSGRDEVLATVPGGASLVVSTPGAEPVADGGYGAVLLLDTWALLTRADLRGTEEALRRWMAAAALARRDGQVVVVAEGGLAVVQALLRFDPGWLAARELADRRELGFPPAVRIAALTGAPTAVAELLAAAQLPPGAEVLGPVPVAAEGQERMLVRTARSAGRALALSLKAAAGVRSARKAPDPVQIQIDPLDLL